MTRGFAWRMNRWQSCNLSTGCLLLLLVLLLQSCASPSARLDQLADEQGFNSRFIKAGGFKLKVYENDRKLLQSTTATGDQSEHVLHVYLEGDGSPWRHRVVVMPDPTPRRPLMLQLMKIDTQSSAYMGRPCYNGTYDEAPCQSDLWTSGRYSEAVILSMASGLRALIKRHKADEVRLFGHSGGGALAMLLAERVTEVRRVITIAGNLDIDAWTTHHSYSPLYSSINPATRAGLDERVWQWHLLAAQDRVIPPQLVSSFIMDQPQASGFLFQGFSHGCCWDTVWPVLLRALAEDNPTLLPARQFKFRAGSISAAGSQ